MASFNERLARAFQAQGHKVTLYTFSLQYPSFMFPGTSQYSTEAAPEDLDIKVLINSVNPFNWIKVGNRLRKEKPDLIVVRYWLPLMGPCFGTILRIAKKNRHSRIVCIADNIIPHEKRFGDKSFTRYFIQPVDAFITMSKKVLADLNSFTSGKPATLTPHPLYDNFGEKISIDKARKNLGIGNNDFILLFFGFIRKYKGLDMLFEAISSIKNSADPIPGLKLLVAGEYYDDEKIYTDQVSRLGIEDMLIMRTGFIADSEIKHYLCAANVIIQPYRNATQSGVTPLAYHFEVPMIVTDVGGLAAMVPDGKAGLIARPDAASIADKIREMFRKGTGHFLPFLQEEKKKYSWEIMTAEIYKAAGFEQ